MHYHDPNVKLIVEALKCHGKLPELIAIISSKISYTKLFRSCDTAKLIIIYQSLLYLLHNHQQNEHYDLDNQDVNQLKWLIPYLADYSQGMQFHVKNAKLNNDLANEILIWQGSTWPNGLSSWLRCSTEKWTITNKRIDYTHGWCEAYRETIDVRRITDIKYHRTFLQFLLLRSTLIFVVSEDKETRYVIPTWGMKKVYQDLRLAWLQSKTNVATNTADGVISGN